MSLKVQQGGDLKQNRHLGGRQAILEHSDPEVHTGHPNAIHR